MKTRNVSSSYDLLVDEIGLNRAVPAVSLISESDGNIATISRGYIIFSIFVIHMSANFHTY